MIPKCRTVQDAVQAPKTDRCAQRLFLHSVAQQNSKTAGQSAVQALCKRCARSNRHQLCKAAAYKGCPAQCPTGAAA